MKQTQRGMLEPCTFRKRAEYGFEEHGFNSKLNEFLCPHRALGGELSELLSAHDLRAKATSPSFSQNSLSLAQNSLSSLFRNNPFPDFLSQMGRLRHVGTIRSARPITPDTLPFFFKGTCGT